MKEAPPFSQLEQLARKIPDHRSTKIDIVQSVSLGLALERGEEVGAEHDPQLDELREKTYKLILLTLG